MTPKEKEKLKDILFGLVFIAYTAESNEQWIKDITNQISEL